MLTIPCPYLGERDEIEFAYCGEAHIVRPTNTAEMSDEAWADYLFNRKNIKGIHLEQWQHTGTRLFFNVARNTVTNEILASYKIGETIDVEALQEKLSCAKK